ncbi:MAG: hypothetical protein ACRDUY_07905 [Nitriliruptorales bacterium]
MAKDRTSPGRRRPGSIAAPTSRCSALDVTREQLASFLTNVLGKLVDDDLADPPL